MERYYTVDVDYMAMASQLDMAFDVLFGPDWDANYLNVRRFFVPKD